MCLEFCRETKATGKSNRKNILTLLDLWKRLNNGQNYFEITFDDIEPNNSLLLTFLSDEFVTRVTLVRTVHKNLSSLNRMLKTKSVDTEMKALISKLSNYKVKSITQKIRTKYLNDKFCSLDTKFVVTNMEGS